MNFEKGHHRLAGALILTGACAAAFVGSSQFNRLRFGPELLAPIQAFPLDALIPFRPDWVWIYLLYYGFCFLPLLLREVRNNRGIFLRTALGFAIQFAVSTVVFLLWPMQITHPPIPEGASGEILNRLYGFDRGFNSFPSLHVANMTFVALLFRHLRRKQWVWGVVFTALLISLSTLLVKQHYVSDVVAGGLLGGFAYMAAFCRRRTTTEIR